MSDVIRSYLKTKFADQFEAQLNEIQPGEMINCTEGFMNVKKMAEVLIDKCEFIQIWWANTLSDGTEFEKFIINRSSIDSVAYLLTDKAEEIIKESNWLKKNRGALQAEVLKYRKTKRILEG
jgi:hypothetical protein